MVTVIVGRNNDLNCCRILTTAEEFSGTKLLEFPLPENRKDLEPGEPFWANYVKGVVAHYEGIYCTVTSSWLNL